MVSCAQNPRHCGGTGGCDGALREVMGSAGKLRSFYPNVFFLQKHEHHDKTELLFRECLPDEIGHVCLVSVSLPCRFHFFHVLSSSSRFYGFSIFLLFDLASTCVIDVPLFCFDLESGFTSTFSLLVTSSFPSWGMVQLVPHIPDHLKVLRRYRF